MTRRRFIEDAARLGGSAYALMSGLGLVGCAARRPIPRGPRASGTTVLVLGAGVAGLSAAYELGRLGFNCRILEARERPGGRVFTIRRGTELVETDGEKQVAAFDEGAYFEAGAMRIPATHETVLGYVREFGLSVAPFINYNESAYY
jgi:monoamine oxidase